MSWKSSTFRFVDSGVVDLEFRRLLAEFEAVLKRADVLMRTTAQPIKFQFMLAVLVDYVRSLNQYSITVEVR